MKKEIEELIKLITADNTGIITILLKAKVLANKIDSSELLDWVNNELNGYRGENVSIPNYRIFVAQVFGRITNGYFSEDRYQIPLNHLTDQIRDILQTIHIRESIGEVEHAIEKADNSLFFPVPSELLGGINNGIALNEGWVVDKATRIVSISYFKGIVSGVKSRLLDLLLELDSSYESIEQIKEASEEVESSVKTIINGNNNIVIAGLNSKQDIDISIKNNIERVREELASSNVSDEDIAEVVEILEEEPELKNNSFGPRLKGWISKMLGKAVEGVWDFALSEAGEKLLNVFNSYYGIS